LAPEGVNHQIPYPCYSLLYPYLNTFYNRETIGIEKPRLPGASGDSLQGV